MAGAKEKSDEAERSRKEAQARLKAGWKPCFEELTRPLEEEMPTRGGNAAHVNQPKRNVLPAQTKESLTQIVLLQTTQHGGSQDSDPFEEERIPRQKTLTLQQIQSKVDELKVVEQVAIQTATQTATGVLPEAELKVIEQVEIQTATQTATGVPPEAAADDDSKNTNWTHQS